MLALETLMDVQIAEVHLYIYISIIKVIEGLKVLSDPLLLFLVQNHK